jgi:hypothetical protein
MPREETVRVLHADEARLVPKSGKGNSNRCNRAETLGNRNLWARAAWVWEMAWDLTALGGSWVGIAVYEVLHCATVTVATGRLNRLISRERKHRTMSGPHHGGAQVFGMCQLLQRKSCITKGRHERQLTNTELR